MNDEPVHFFNRSEKKTLLHREKKNLMQPWSKAGKPLPNSINSIYIFQIVGNTRHAQWKILLCYLIGRNKENTLIKLFIV